MYTDNALFTPSYPAGKSKANPSRKTQCSSLWSIWKVDTKRASHSRLIGYDASLEILRHIFLFLTSGGENKIFHHRGTSRKNSSPICPLHQQAMWTQYKWRYMSSASGNSGCHDKIPYTTWLKITPIHFFTVRGAGSPRPRVQAIWFLLRTGFWLTDRYLLVSSHAAEKDSLPLQEVSRRWCLFL